MRCKGSLGWMALPSLRRYLDPVQVSCKTSILDDHLGRRLTMPANRFLAATVRVVLLAASLALSGTVFPSGGAAPAFPGKPQNLDFVAGERAIQAKDWPLAIAYFSRVTDDQDFAAGAYNWMGYAERQQGHLDAAFGYYDKALAIDPRHLGAHEYIGEAYLMAGNLAKAEEHLAILDKLCSRRCEEYADLKRKIGDYMQGKH
jgi:tetratricopeptide (TPR) repeat protein